MTRIKSFFFATLLTLAVSSSALAGEITGRTGEITGRTGEITGLVGTILDVFKMVL